MENGRHEPWNKVVFSQYKIPASDSPLDLQNMCTTLPMSFIAFASHAQQFICIFQNSMDDKKFTYYY